MSTKSLIVKLRPSKFLTRENVCFVVRNSDWEALGQRYGMNRRESEIYIQLEQRFKDILKEEK